MHQGNGRGRTNVLWMGVFDLSISENIVFYSGTGVGLICGRGSTFFVVHYGWRFMTVQLYWKFEEKRQHK